MDIENRHHVGNTLKWCFVCLLVSPESRPEELQHKAEGHSHETCNNDRRRDAMQY